MKRECILFGSLEKMMAKKQFNGQDWPNIRRRKQKRNKRRRPQGNNGKEVLHLLLFKVDFTLISERLLKNMDLRWVPNAHHTREFEK